MDRLTRRMPGGWGVVEGYELNTLQGMRAVTTRLAAYENTGLAPEDIERFKENYDMAISQFADYLALGTLETVMKWSFAEADGRLVILPCKVTDTVYIIEGVYKGRKQVGEKVVPAKIDRVIIGGTTGKPVYDLCTEPGSWYMSMEPGDFFLTREEAEKEARKGRETK